MGRWRVEVATVRGTAADTAGEWRCAPTGGVVPVSPPSSEFAARIASAPPLDHLFCCHVPTKLAGSVGLSVDPGLDLGVGIKGAGLRCAVAACGERRHTADLSQRAHARHGWRNCQHHDSGSSKSTSHQTFHDCSPHRTSPAPTLRASTAENRIQPQPTPHHRSRHWAAFGRLLPAQGHLPAGCDHHHRAGPGPSERKGQRPRITHVSELEVVLRRVMRDILRTRGTADVRATACEFISALAVRVARRHTLKGPESRKVGESQVAKVAYPPSADGEAAGRSVTSTSIWRDGQAQVVPGSASALTSDRCAGVTGSCYGIILECCAGCVSAGRRRVSRSASAGIRSTCGSWVSRSVGAVSRSARFPACTVHDAGT